jgi:hypothetical protein
MIILERSKPSERVTTRPDNPEEFRSSLRFNMSELYLLNKNANNTHLRFEAPLFFIPSIRIVDE